MIDYKVLKAFFLGERETWRIPAYGEVWLSNGHYYLACPVCGEACSLDDYTVTIEDKKVNIQPSIVCSLDCGAHFIVHRNYIQPV